MGWWNPVHQGSGRTTLFGGWPIMLCGKVVRCTPASGWMNTGKQVDCTGCLRKMR